jgi:hypothetical protein
MVREFNKKIQIEQKLNSESKSAQNGQSKKPISKDPPKTIQRKLEPSSQPPTQTTATLSSALKNSVKPQSQTPKTTNDQPQK